MLALALAAALLAAPAAAPADNSKATEAAVQAADSAAKAAASAAQAADSAAKAADRAAVAAEKAAAAAERSAPVAASVADKAAAEKLVADKAAAEKVAADKAAAEKAAAAPRWKGTLGVGAILLTGNAETLTFTSGLALEHKGEEWISAIKAYGAYGQTTTTATAAGVTTNTNNVTALKAGASVRGDRRFTPIFSGYLQASLSTDHVASIESRPLGEVGASIIWFDVKEGDLAKTSLKTDLGFVAGREYRQNYYPVSASLPAYVNIIAPHLGVAYKYAVSKEIAFSNDLDLSPNVLDTVRVLLADTAKLAARLTETINLAVGFTLTWDSVPAQGKKEVDTATLISLEVAL
jgi:putative salt-induced outer membrane protein YdiY